MKRSLSIGLSMLASILLIFVIAFTMLQQIINNETFINNEFTKLGVADAMGMNNADLVAAMTTLVDYMEGDADSIEIMVTVSGQKVPMFELEQEQSHMEDVRLIYQTVRQYRDMAALALLVLFLLAAVINFRQAPRSLAQGFLFGAFVMLVIFGFIGTWAAMDFSSFWTLFHEALFWNDEWLFDASESRMINMLPEGMFAGIAARLGLYAGGIVALLIALSIGALLLSSERYRRAQAAAKERRKLKKAYRANRAAILEERRLEAEKAKRIAEKKAARAAARQKAEEEAEKQRIAEEKALLAAKRAREKAAAKKQRAEERTREAGARATRTAPLRGASAAKPAPAKKTAARPAKRKSRGNVQDDTGFFDE
ncbi:MAG: DUF1461 domain-containing protein [Clostridia bacterium]|nr:DUF1461 domain-containing protein [Clostridia bacterium]